MNSFRCGQKKIMVHQQAELVCSKAFETLIVLYPCDIETWSFMAGFHASIDLL